MTNRRSEISLLVLAASLAVAPAFAQPAGRAADSASKPTAAPGSAAAPDAAGGTNVAEARDAFRVGSALAKQAQWTEALSAFDRSAKLRSHPVTTYNIAFCERALGRATRAKKNFARAMAESSPGMELPPDLVAQAKGYLAELEHRVARAVVDLTRDGASLAVDGRPLEPNGGGASHPSFIAGTRDLGPAEPVSARSFDLLLDPGVHVIVVAVPGEPDAVTTREFTAGATLALTLGPTGAPPSKQPIAGPTPGTPPVPASNARRTWSYVSFAIGGVGAIVGGALGGAALGKKSSLDKVCATKSACPAGSQGDIDKLNAFSLGSTIGIGVGVAGIAMGTALLLTSGTPKAAAAPATGGLVLEPVVGAGYGGLRGSF